MSRASSESTVRWREAAMIDPSDSGAPATKRWEEIRAQYASIVLLHWVFRDLGREVPEAIADLSSRLWTSIDSYPDIMRKDAAQRGEEWHGEVPFHGRDGDIEFWPPWRRSGLLS